MFATLDAKQPWGRMSLLPPLPSQTSEKPGFMSITSGYENTEDTAAGDISIQQLLEWVNSNVCQSRPFRSRQLYIWGPPAVGKTTFLRLLEKSLRIYYMPTDENFYDMYDDDDYDLIVIDEFKGQKTIQDLNRWLDGQNMSIRQKGRQCMKLKNLPVIIVSNFPPHIVYRNKFEKGELEPFTSRVVVVEIKTMIPFERIVSAPTPPPLVSTEEEIAIEALEQMQSVAQPGRIVVDLTGTSDQEESNLSDVMDLC